MATRGRINDHSADAAAGIAQVDFLAFPKPKRLRYETAD